MLSEKEYENIIMRNDKFTEDTLTALSLVKKYIIDNNLVIVGGMAIDLSLKLKGSRLYSDNVLPDYDFYSPNHASDAYKIAEILYRAKLRNITVINANHVSTMRVRVNYIVVADITYMPPNIFPKLPILQYKGFKIIHPHYQMIDQHRALSMPFENPPWEVITHRWKKDAKRYDILYKYYPVGSESEIKCGNNKPEEKISSINFKNQCLGGFAAMAYWQYKARKYGFKKPQLGNIAVDVVGMSIAVPLDSHGITIYSNDITKLYGQLKPSCKKERMYRRFLDKLPFKIILDDKWEILDNAGCMLGAHKLDNDIYVANLQNVMLYMLANYILLNKIKDINRGQSFYAGYIMARDLILWASGKSGKKYEVFFPTIKVYGDSEISDSYLNSERMFLAHLKEQPKQNLQPRSVFSETFVNGKIPKSYFKFNAKNSKLFQFDGRETKKIILRV